MNSDLNFQLVTNSHDPELVSLVRKSDEYLESLYPPESNHAESIEALMGDKSYLFAAYAEDTLVACGAIKLASDDGAYGEIKRVYVDENYRGKRIAQSLMQHLEAELIKFGMSIARLEAGPLQPAALALYRKLGYVDRGPFGAYKPDPLSIFMEKNLGD